MTSEARPAGAGQRLLGFLARRLSIKHGEGTLVFFVSAAYFLVLGGTVIGRNARDSLFLKNFGVANLPYMYVASGLLVVASSTLYSSLLERIERRRFINLCTLSFCTLLAASRFTLLARFRWFYPVLYMVCQSISIVSGMLFWTATEELFDTRQAKRIFPLVSAAGILSMTASGFFTKPLVLLLGSENLFLVWGGLLAVTFFLFRAAARSSNVAAPTPPAKPAQARKWTEAVWQGLVELKSTRLLRAMAAIAIFNSITFSLVDFQFSQVVTETYKSQDDLTSFLGIFRGVSGVLGLLIQVAGTPWLMSAFGVGTTIAVEPFLMTVAAIGMLVSLNFGTAVTARFIDNTLYFTVQGSAFQLLFNPLPLDHRPRIRAFIEGYFRPLMAGLGGVLLLVGNELLSRRQISFCAGVAGAAWLISSLKTRRGYIEALIENLGKANVAQHLSAADALAKIKSRESLAALAHAIRTAPAESAVPAILLLEQFGQPESQEVIINLLDHPEPHIRATAVAALGRLGNRALVAHLNRLLEDPDPRTRANAVEACGLVNLGGPREDLQQRLNDPATRVRANALAVVTKLEDTSPAELLPQVEEMCRSQDHHQRAAAAYALAWFPSSMAQPILLRLLDDPEPHPRAAAVRSLEKVGTATCIPGLLSAVCRTRALRRACRRTLVSLAAREPEEAFNRLVAGVQADRNGIMPLTAYLLGRLGRHEAFPCLIGILMVSDPACREEALGAIERLAEKHSLSAEGRTALENFASVELKQLEENIERRQAALTLTKSVTTGLVANWLADEMLGEHRRMQRRILRATAILHEAKRVREVARGLEDPDPRKKANALEALEYLAPGGLGKRLAQCLEREQQWDTAPNRRRQDWVSELAGDRSPAVRAGTLLLVERGQFSDCLPLVENGLRDSAPIVREVALRATRRLLGPQALPRLEGMQHDPDARVCRLAEILVRQANERVSPSSLGSSASAAVPAPEVSMLLTVEKVLFLKSVPLFSSLDGEQLASLAGIAQESEIEAGKVIFEMGDTGDDLYVVISGRLKVYRGKPGSEALLAELGERECFGEMALLDAEPRSASVAALDPCRLIIIGGEDFRELIHEKPEIAMELLKTLARRLRHMDVEAEERVHVASLQQFVH